MQPLTGAELKDMLDAFIARADAAEADAFAMLKRRLHARVISVVDLEVMLAAVAEVVGVEVEDVAIELDLRRWRRGNELVV